MRSNILIVDDIQSNLDTLNFMIDDIDFDNEAQVNVMQARSGNDALNIAIQNELALIILDIQMPEMDGFEVAKFLKKSSKTRDIPIIFLTAAYKSEQMREHGLKIGAFDYFLKPIDPLLLVPKIKLYINLFTLNAKLKNSNVELEKKIQKAIAQNSQMEARLYQSEKMAAMGEMIGNIAHQWRQPLAIIAMWANNITMDIDIDEVDNDNLKKYSDNIIEQTKHLSQTIDDFRNFFAPNKEQNTFTLQESIDRTMKLLDASLKAHDVKVITNIANITITALENELTQAFLNIIKNAKDVLINQEQNKQKLIFIDIYEKDNKAIIDIKDNGGGIKDDILDKVFEPYFTTKHKSQGTGIGLYMTQTIITKHLNGHIYVKNVEYLYEEKNCKGAIFSIQLPLG